MIRARGEGHTLVVAIEIPDPVGELLDAERARYTPDPGEMPAHVTLLAPVDVDLDVLAPVIRHLEQVAARTEPFPMVLRGTGTFRPVSPVVFVAVADGIAACEQLEQAVRSGEFAVETRFPYHPHVTIAHDVPEDQLDDAFARLATFEAQFTVRSMSLRENVDGKWVLVREFALGAD